MKPLLLHQSLYTYVLKDGNGKAGKRTSEQQRSVTEIKNG